MPFRTLTGWPGLFSSLKGSEFHTDRPMPLFHLEEGYWLLRAVQCRRRLRIGAIAKGRIVMAVQVKASFKIPKPAWCAWDRSKGGTAAACLLPPRYGASKGGRSGAVCVQSCHSATGVRCRLHFYG